MSFLKKLFASLKSRQAKADQPQEQVPAAPPVSTDPDEADIAQQASGEASSTCRTRHWQRVGTVEPDVLSYLISPSLTGGPDWPTTRQAYGVVRRGENILLTTEGLSDPFDGVEGMGNGFEMELFLETGDIPDQAKGVPGEVSPLMNSWAFELLRHVAGTVANAGGITHQLDQYGVLSLEIPGYSQSHAICEQVPASFVSADDSVGVLLGGPPPDFATLLTDMPLSPVRLVPVVLITAAELEFVRSGGETARDELVARLQAAGIDHVSSLQRASVL